MIDEDVVKSGLAYMEQCRAQKATPTLRGLVGHIDTHKRIVVTLDEINEILRSSPSLTVQRIDGRVQFSPEGFDRQITTDDLDRAFADCQADFEARRRRRRSELR
jgi:hypothetical protein